MGRKTKKRFAKRKKTARKEAKATTRAAFPDARLITVRVEAVGGVPVEEPMFVYPVDRLRLPDGKILAFHAPSMPAFYLVTAKGLRDSGERERKRVMRGIGPARHRGDWADVDVKNDSLAMDAIGKLASAVILAAGAVEAYANEAIDRLDAKDTVEIKRRGETKTIARPDMVRQLNLEEKLDLVVPKVAGTTSIKAREPWPRFKRLNELRGEVVHVKARGRTDDPDIPSVLGRLLLGEGSKCVEDAAAVIVAYEPNWLPEAARNALGLISTGGGGSGRKAEAA
jgi:hypothetical protein